MPFIALETRPWERFKGFPKEGINDAPFKIDYALQGCFILHLLI
jgi:hypothetical protein